MVLKITNNEYIKILEFYKIPIPGTKKLIKKEAEKILSEKLCKCLKKVQQKPMPEGKAIGICTKTIFNNKGLTRGKFRCLKNRTLKFRRTNK